ncbi:hypothetical protein ACFL96_19820, partial [Thermoproteota archaeon]
SKLFTLFHNKRVYIAPDKLKSAKDYCSINYHEPVTTEFEARLVLLAFSQNSLPFKNSRGKEYNVF